MDKAENQPLETVTFPHKSTDLSYDLNALSLDLYGEKTTRLPDDINKLIRMTSLRMGGESLSSTTPHTLGLMPQPSIFYCFKTPDQIDRIFEFSVIETEDAQKILPVIEKADSDIRQAREKMNLSFKTAKSAKK